MAELISAASEALIVAGTMSARMVVTGRTSKMSGHWRQLRAAVLIVLAVAVNRGALAGDFDWMNKDQMSAVSTLAAGYAGGLRCDRLVDSAVAGAFLTKAFGGRSFSAQEVAAIGKMITGIIAAQAIFGADARACATVRKAFGPGGTNIPGLLD